MNTILLATDGSPSAAHALQFAIELCRETGARLYVLTVRTLKQHGDRDAPFGDQMDIQPVIEEIAADAARVARLVGVEAEPCTAYGSPAPMIAATGDDLEADLIVVGSHGRGDLASGVLGSVSRGLLGSTRIPVTVVRGVRMDVPLAVGAAH
jgi:nucleotide-binding universal stress UspA family protein